MACFIRDCWCRCWSAWCKIAKLKVLAAARWNWSGRHHLISGYLWVNQLIRLNFIVNADVLAGNGCWPVDPRTLGAMTVKKFKPDMQPWESRHQLVCDWSDAECLNEQIRYNKLKSKLASVAEIWLWVFFDFPDPDDINVVELRDWHFICWLKVLV